MGVSIVGLVALATPSASASAGWTIQPTVNTSKQNQLRAVSCTSATACTAVGFAGTGTLAERWDGNSWAVQTTPSPRGVVSPVELFAVSCVSTTVCTAVGAAGTGTLAERWNGTRWFVQPTPTAGSGGGTLFGVSCTSSSVCTAVGSTAGTGGVGSAGGAPLVERFTGTKWVVQSTPSLPGGRLGFLKGVSCTAATACLAVGYSYTGGFQTAQALAERWNGSTWAILRTSTPDATSEFNGVSCASATVCTAVGDNLSGQPLVEGWDGGIWTFQPTPIGYPNFQATLSSVSCPSATDCIAAGNGYSPGTPGASMVAEVWNGSKWTLQSPPSVKGAGPGQLLGVSCTPLTICIAVGWCGPGGPDSSTLAEQYR